MAAVTELHECDEAVLAAVVEVLAVLDDPAPLVVAVEEPDELEQADAASGSATSVAMTPMRASRLLVRALRFMA